MEIKKIKELAGLMQESDLTALEIKEGDTSIRLERRPADKPAGQPDPGHPHGIAETAGPFTPAAHAQAKEGTLVTSPTVGVFYAAPSPESSPFVQVGDKIRQGDTLCIIEAMKLMNEIPAELDGTVAEVCVGNGEVVEFGQPLFRIV